MRLGVQGNIQGKTWIHNAREARWQHRLQENAVTPPQTMPASWGTAYECPIHKAESEKEDTMLDQKTVVGVHLIIP